MVGGGDFMATIWLIVAVMFFVGELVCPTFFLFWFAIGALVALLTTFITANLAVQIIVFLVISIILLIFMKPLTNRLFKNNAKDDLNMNGIIGKNAIVTKEIDNVKGVGEVKVHGEIWRAVNQEERIIESGKQVVIQKIDGVKLIVKELSENVKKD